MIIIIISITLIISIIVINIITILIISIIIIIININFVGVVTYGNTRALTCWSKRAHRATLASDLDRFAALELILALALEAGAVYPAVVALAHDAVHLAEGPNDRVPDGAVAKVPVAALAVVRAAFWSARVGERDHRIPVQLRRVICVRWPW